MRRKLWTAAPAGPSGGDLLLLRALHSHRAAGLHAAPPPAQQRSVAAPAPPANDSYHMAYPDGGWVRASPFRRRLALAGLPSAPRPTPPRFPASNPQPHTCSRTLRRAGGDARAGGVAAAAAGVAAALGTCMTIARRCQRAARLAEAWRMPMTRRSTPRAATTSPCASPPRAAALAKSATPPVRLFSCRMHARALAPYALPGQDEGSGFP